MNEYSEVISHKPSGNLIPSKLGIDDLLDLFEDSVTLFISVSIVYQLESVDICVNHRILMTTRKNVLSLILKLPSVLSAGDIISSKLPVDKQIFHHYDQYKK